MIIYYTDKYNGGRGESHRLLEKAFAVHTGDEERAKTLTGAMKKGEHGKPYIEGFCCFSISHTGSIWAVLIAERECGLDIQLGRKCNIRAIAERWFAPEDAAVITELCSKDETEFCNKNELELYDHAESSEKYGENAINAFFRIWARREALTKALGSTVYDPDLPAVTGAEAGISGKHYMLADIAFPDSINRDLRHMLYAAVCAEGTEDCFTDSDVSFCLL